MISSYLRSDNISLHYNAAKGLLALAAKGLSLVCVCVCCDEMYDNWYTSLIAADLLFRECAVALCGAARSRRAARTLAIPERGRPSLGRFRPPPPL